MRLSGGHAKDNTFSSYGSPRVNNSKINTSMTGMEWTMIITLSVLWGGSFFFVGVAVQDLPTMTIVVTRVGLAAIILIILMRVRGISFPTNKSVWGTFLIMGFLNNAVPFLLIVWGQSHIASGVASILNATTPLFAVVIAHVLTIDEKLTPLRFFGVVMGIIGVAGMIGGKAIAALGTDVIAQVAILGAAISYSFAGIFGRRFRAMGVSPIATATGQVAASSLMLLPIMLMIDQPWTLPMPGMDTILSLIALAGLSTALAYILYFKILETAGATNLMLVTFLVPISAVLLGIGFLNEALEARHLFGMALIGTGLVAIDGRMFKKLWEKH
jgi:drug/metabolite transporter (DMT)-like permease